MSNDKPKTGLTSVEAAALYLSNGRTKDPTLAGIIDENRQNELDMDGLQRAHLRRMMGFDFEIQIMSRAILVTAKGKGKLLRTRAKMYPGDIEAGQITNEAAVDRLVEACVRLKQKHAAEQRKDKQ
jgi:hypothetical protein